VYNTEYVNILGGKFKIWCTQLMTVNQYGKIMILKVFWQRTGKGQCKVYVCMLCS